ncbi:MAG TPA: DUF4395 domain-containing protein [Acidimicrobiales bacterium]|nr:DUF4395 domain-containing protein [Acidimicrobiales bacterium]
MVARIKSLLSFPNPVNEVAARVVAGVVVLMCVTAIALRQQWLLVAVAYGFWARTLTGPKLSPLGLLATRVVAPRLGPAKLVAGPPKRFAQAMGAGFSTAAVTLWFGFSEHLAAWGVVGALVAAASLESFAGYCLGCRIFSLLMSAGVIPRGVCEACGDLRLRHPELAIRQGVGVL